MAATSAGAGPQTSISSPNASLLAERLRRYASRIEDPRPEFEELIRVLQAGEGQIFDSGGRAMGSNWAAVADPEQKADPRILVATGTLRASLASQTSDSVAVATSTELRFSTHVPYGRFHEYGTARMPARPFMGISDHTRQQVLDLMRRLEMAVA